MSNIEILDSDWQTANVEFKHDPDWRKHSPLEFMRGIAPCVVWVVIAYYLMLMWGVTF